MLIQLTRRDVRYSEDESELFERIKVVNGYYL